MLTNTAPITFSFLNREFCRFVDESKTDTEILEILIALCDTLENASSASATEEMQREPRPSIADPVVPKNEWCGLEANVFESGRDSTDTKNKDD